MGFGGYPIDQVRILATREVKSERPLASYDFEKHNSEAVNIALRCELTSGKVPELIIMVDESKDQRNDRGIKLQKLRRESNSKGWGKSCNN